jgi:hypothetical protein
MLFAVGLALQADVAQKKTSWGLLMLSMAVSCRRVVNADAMLRPNSRFEIVGGKEARRRP